jgi:thiol:disulfide interchange protein
VACKEQMKVFETADFEKAAAGFVGVLVDVTDNEDEKVRAKMAAHKILGVPAVLLLDSTGQEMYRASSLEPLDKWVTRLAQVK